MFVLWLKGFFGYILKWSGSISTDRWVFFRTAVGESSVLELNSFWGRFLGIKLYDYSEQIAKQSPILFFPRTRALHQLFSNYPLVVVFIDYQGKVLRQDCLRIGRVMTQKGAWGAFECLPEQKWQLLELLDNEKTMRQLLN